MATSRNGDQFRRRLDLIARSVGSALDRAVRKAALAADQTAVLATPVDTGRARANWIVTVGDPAGEADRPNDKSGQSAIAQGQGQIAARRPGETIYITNNVEYIGFLEEGSSAQAPNGMLQAARQVAEAVARGARVLTRS